MSMQETIPAFTFNGEVEIETFLGPVNVPIAFTLSINEEADLKIADKAAETLTLWMAQERLKALAIMREYD